MRAQFTLYLTIILSLFALPTAAAASDTLHLKSLENLRRHVLFAGLIEIEGVDADGDRHLITGTIEEQFLQECWVLMSRFEYAPAHNKTLTLTVKNSSIQIEQLGGGITQTTYNVHRSSGSEISNCAVTKPAATVRRSHSTQHQGKGK